MASGLFHMYKFMWPFAEVHLVLCSHDTCFSNFDILDSPGLLPNFSCLCFKGYYFLGLKV